MTNTQLGTLSKYRKQPVWSVVLPIMPGSSATTTICENVPYDVAAQAALGARAGRPWIHLGARVVEILCAGKFHSFGC